MIGIGGSTNDIKLSIKALKDLIVGLNPDFLILISHVAPFEHCDLAYDGRNIGSKHLLGLIKELQDKIKKNLVCCGHVHEQWTCNNRVGNAEIWNIGPKGILFEIEDFNIKTNIF
ncbi:MAG: hypothetical protein ACTSRG_22595 [Candidatus Helarchaeota archaeon]